MAGTRGLGLWLKDVDFRATEFWTADADDAGQNDINRETSSKKASICFPRIQTASGYCAGRIEAKTSHLKLHRLHDKYNDLAINTFAEKSTPKTQIISIKGFQGSSSNPVVLSSGYSVAFLKRRAFVD